MQDEIQRLGPSVEALTKDGVIDTILTKVTIFRYFLLPSCLPACLSVFLSGFLFLVWTLR